MMKVVHVTLFPSLFDTYHTLTIHYSPTVTVALIELPEGLPEGLLDGMPEGLLEGFVDGLLDGFLDGLTDGRLDTVVGGDVGFPVKLSRGADVGLSVNLSLARVVRKSITSLLLA